MPTTTKMKKTAVTQKVLLVEDEGELGLVLNMVLSERPVELDYAKSLLAADEYLETNKPSLIILDNKLPDGFGVDFISYIKKNHPGIKIIMISGFASVRDVALANGADMFFEKPFSLEEFNTALDKLLN
jgi:two-component system OmpR family response regulator